MSDTGKQEVEVTDIRMRFGSMVLFMVKWAIASIPAVIILVVLTAVVWGLTIGLVGSIRASSYRHALSHTTTSSTGEPRSTPSDLSSQVSAEEAAYLPSVVVKGVTVGKSALGETGVFGEVKNGGDHALKRVELTIYCLGPDGKPVFEKNYPAVLVSQFGSETPLKPGYTRTFGVRMDDAPSDWTKKVDVKVSQIKFQ